MFYSILTCMFKFSLFGCFVPMKFGIHEDQSLSLFDTKFQHDPAQNDPKIANSWFHRYGLHFCM